MSRMRVMRGLSLIVLIAVGINYTLTIVRSLVADPMVYQGVEFLTSIWSLTATGALLGLAWQNGYRLLGSPPAAPVYNPVNRR